MPERDPHGDVSGARPSLEDERRDRDTTMRDLGRFAGLGVTLAVTLCVFAWGGYALDQRLGTLPLFLLLGVAAGFLGGTISMVRKVQAGSDSPQDSTRP